MAITQQLYSRNWDIIMSKDVDTPPDWMVFTKQPFVNPESMTQSISKREVLCHSVTLFEF